MNDNRNHRCEPLTRLLQWPIILPTTTWPHLYYSGYRKTGGSNFSATGGYQSETTLYIRPVSEFTATSSDDADNNIYTLSGASLARPRHDDSRHPLTPPQKK